MTPFKSHQLKIKTVSLGLEGALIHREECKIKDQIERAKLSENPQKDAWLARLRSIRDSLREHRKVVVRPYTRNAILAYGFLRGRAYAQMEPKRYTDPDWGQIERMILKHGGYAGLPTDLLQTFERWKQEAGELAKRK